MRRNLDETDRMALVLSTESRRMREAAERVDLVAQAFALQRGVSSAPREVASEPFDFGA